MQSLSLFLFILLSSGYVMLLDYFAYSSRGLQKSLVIPIVIILILIYRFSGSDWRLFLSRQGKWFLVLWGTVIVQTLVIATGGLQSPFLVLIHLFMITLSFLFNFAAALFFLIASSLVLIFDISRSNDLATFFLTNPSTFLLQLISLLSILPLAYILAQQYHINDMLSKVLRTKITIDEAIIETIDELIIITDPTFTILSVNDAVVKALQKPRSVLIHEPLFDVILLKNDNGKLLQDTNILNALKKDKQYTYHEALHIINTQIPNNNFHLQIQTMYEKQTHTNQLTFILSPITHTVATTPSSLALQLQQAKGKYEGLREELKKTLATTDNQSFMQLILLEKFETDIATVNSITSTPFTSRDARIDIALLCNKLVVQQQTFAKGFNTTLECNLIHFGNQQIAPLTVKNYHIQPSQLTGPFFTIFTNARGTELLIKTLLEIAILISSSTKNPHVALELENKEEKEMILSIIANSPTLTKQEQNALTTHKYSKYHSAPLQAVSGLEGYIIQTISTQLRAPVKVTYTSSKTKNNHICFTVKLQRTFEETSK